MQFNSPILITVVLYQIAVRQSTTLQCLHRHLANTSNCIVLVYDNGSENQSAECQAYFQQYPFRLIYQHNAANPGVAAAYNFAGRLAQQQSITHLVLFDQDTTIPPEYFEEIIILQNRLVLPQLWLPQVQLSSGRLISPSRFRMGRFWLFSPDSMPVGEVPAGNLSAINSGLVIGATAFDSANGYDERFPLDLSDHVFLYRYKQQYHSLYIMQAKLQHSLSVAGRTDLSSALRRYGIQKKASLLFGKQTGNYLHLFWCIIFGVRLCIRYRTVAFLNPFENHLFTTLPYEK